MSTGAIAMDFVMAVKSCIPESTIIAVASRNLSQAEDFAKKTAIPKFYGSYEELTKDPEVDVVYIGTPHNAHKEGVLLCLNNGKSVLCEKAITINSKDLKELIDLATSKKLFLMEAMWMCYFPPIEKIHSLISEGIIGDIKHVSALFGFEITPSHNKRLTDPNLGGGAILDIGVYVITFAYSLFKKPPNKIVALGNVVNGEYDHQTSAILEFDSAHAQVSCGFGANYTNEALIIGNKGTIRVHPPFWCPVKITLTLNGKEPEDLVFPLPHVHHKFNFSNSVGLHYEAKYVEKCLREGKLQSSVHSLQDSYEVMKIMDTIRDQISLKYPSEKNK